MTDLLIRNVDPEVLARIDRHAARLGLTRNEYLRRQLEQDAARTDASVTMADLERFAEDAAGLLDEELMRRAWS